MQRVQKEVSADVVEMWCVKSALVFYIRKEKFTFKKQITEEVLKWSEVSNEVIFDNIIKEFKEMEPSITMSIKRIGNE